MVAAAAQHRLVHVDPVPAGRVSGRDAGDAFFVKCDAETTTQADIDLGMVNVLVGFAPLKPAEFVIVQISQKAGQATS